MSFLGRSVRTESLVRDWPAWALTIYPPTSARLLTHTHVPIFESFVESPETHRRASLDARTAGGPFIAAGEEAVSEVKAIWDRTTSASQQLTDLSSFIDRVNAHLLDSMGGALSVLEPTTSPLWSLVDIGYDLLNRASLRFVEPLVYRSAFYRRSDQAFVLSKTDELSRPFMLSNPRIVGSDELKVTTAFSSASAAELLTSRWRSTNISRLADELGVEDSDRELFTSFFTDTPPNHGLDRSENGTWYLGHACVLFRHQGSSILIDPLVPWSGSAGARWTLDDLPRHIDVVALTHAHPDHTVLETLLALRPIIGKIVVPSGARGTLHDPSLRHLLTAIGFSDVLELDDFDSIDVSTDLRITAVPFLGEHGDLDIRCKSGYVVDCDGVRSYCAADSTPGWAEMTKAIAAECGPIDVVLIGMESVGAPVTWLYGGLLPDGMNRRDAHARRLRGCNATEARSIVQALGAKSAYAYAMGAEPWLRHITSAVLTEDSRQTAEAAEFVRACADTGISATVLAGQRTL